MGRMKDLLIEQMNEERENEMKTHEELYDDYLESIKDGEDKAYENHLNTLDEHGNPKRKRKNTKKLYRVYPEYSREGMMAYYDGNVVWNSDGMVGVEFEVEEND